MTSIEQILRQAINPFDSVNFRPGNFWQESQDSQTTVNSIHQEEIGQMTEMLDLVNSDRRTRTILLCGDSGAGKSHLLDRFKQTLNQRAFFAYIGPWVDRDFLWRHILRNTVDSLLEVPRDRQESQLLIWLKSLSIFEERSLIDRWLGDRKAFIRKLRGLHPSDLYNSNEFLSVLYDLLDPEKFLIASDWLRGENLDDEDLNRLRVRYPIETEDAAHKILANFGRLSVGTFPIVLCFDNLDCIAGTTDGEVNLQYLLNFNSTIHNEKFKNFLIVVSLITHTARRYVNRMQPSDWVRIDRQILLKPITLSQATSLYRTRLFALHQQANPKPISPIFPLEYEILDKHFPGGKTNPRNALEIARKLVLEYKAGSGVDMEDSIAAFQLLWFEALRRTQKQIARIRQFSSLELVQMLKRALAALNTDRLTQKSLFPHRYSSFTLSYYRGDRKIGLIWSEDPNLTHFFYIMKACQEILDRDLCDSIILIRSQGWGKLQNKGYQIHKKIFTQENHIHLIPNLESVCYLATYQNLFYAAASGELTLGSQTIDIQALKHLSRESKVWHHLPLLKDLGIVSERDVSSSSSQISTAREFIIQLIKTQQLIGRSALIENTMARFLDLDRVEIEELLDRIVQEKQIKVLDPEAMPREQLICIISD